MYTYIHSTLNPCFNFKSIPTKCFNMLQNANRRQKINCALCWSLSLFRKSACAHAFTGGLHYVLICILRYLHTRYDAGTTWSVAILEAPRCISTIGVARITISLYTLYTPHASPVILQLCGPISASGCMLYAFLRNHTPFSFLSFRHFTCVPSRKFSFSHFCRFFSLFVVIGGD